MNITDLINNMNSAQDLASLETAFDEALGKKGRLSGQYASLKDLSPEDKKRVGGELAQAKSELAQTYESRLDILKTEYINNQLEQDIVDISTPHPKHHQ